MTTLIDDCLLLVFDNLDTVSLASAAQGNFQQWNHKTLFLIHDF